MNTSIQTFSPIRKLAETISLLFRRPARIQLAALCYRETNDGPEVLLITSRNTRRLIIPKGWPIAKISARKTVKREAFEEAGIIGKVSKDPIGEFSSHKGMGNGFKVRTNVIVYALRVEEQLTDFPEQGQRDLIWLPLEEAAKRCQEPGLKHLLQSNSVKTLLIASN